MPPSAKEGAGSDAGRAVDLHALYLRRVAAHEEQKRRRRETDAALAEAEEGLLRLRQAGHEAPSLERVPDSPAMTALREAAAGVLEVGDQPNGMDYRSRRLDYLRVEMALLAEYEEALSRRNQVRACLARAFGDRPDGARLEELTQIRAETPQLRAENSRLRERLLRLGVDPDAAE